MVKHQHLFAATTIAFIALLFLTFPTSAKLNPNYYEKTCPRLHQILTDVVATKQTATPTTAAGVLRLYFHDCFVGGCDASILIASNHFNHAEVEGDINHFLPGDAFDIIVRAKTALELECPGIVSCSDILAITMRDLLVLLGGPFIPIKLGRKDGLQSVAASVESNLPRTNQTMDKIISLFGSKGFSVQEMVALVGAHTVGFSHCKEFANRIYNYKGGNGTSFDPSLNPNYAQALQKACTNYLKDETIAAFNDIMTPGKFDNLYYQNLLNGLGLLESDTALAVDPRTKKFVELYAANQSIFFKDFSHAMLKLSVLGVKTGRKGEVRRRCDQFNNVSV